jgi:CheY-like chemotaxis protein/HPt (histidine-containing phosphotransfer) domain-containing protein
VEDNEVNRLVAEGILKNLGLPFEAVGNGAEALAALERDQFSLVLMDVQMPVMDGLEATRRIRDLKLETRNAEARSTVIEAGQRSGRTTGPASPVSSFQFPSTRMPIIAMTAHAMQGDRETCLAAGMDDYLAKPISPKALADMLGKWLCTPSTAARAFQVFNRPALLERLMGDQALAGTIVQRFLADMPRRMKALRDYLEAGDAVGAEREAHTIKGASASVGCEALQALAFELEQAARRGEIGRLKGRMDELRFEFERLKEVIR